MTGRFDLITNNDPLGHGNAGPAADRLTGWGRAAGDGNAVGNGSAGAGNAAPVADIATMASYLINGYWGFEGQSARHWAYNTVSVNLAGLTGAEQGLALTALDLWHDVANVSFALTSGPANITFNHNGSMTAVTYDNVSGPYLTGATIDISSDWYPGAGGTDTYMFQSYIHEIGHALGLGHQGPYNNTATYGVNNIFANDTWQSSIMSYFSQDKFGGGTYTWVTTPQMNDIFAIQEIYGANHATRLGNTTYGFHSNAGPIFDFSHYTYVPSFTIYDSGGNDTFDCSLVNVNQLINLHPGTWSSVDGGVNNVGIYLTTIVENAIGANRIDGGAGSNLLSGGGGADQFIFDTPLLSTFDRISDFNPHANTIDLSHLDFAALNGPGQALATAMFHVGSGFTNAGQRIDYNPANGWLTYDSNGSRAGGHPIHFMTLAAHLDLHHTDFVMIA
jgi:serralysin